jgi:hypothetical protein
MRHTNRIPVRIIMTKRPQRLQRRLLQRLGNYTFQSTKSCPTRSRKLTRLFLRHGSVGIRLGARMQMCLLLADSSIVFALVLPTALIALEAPGRLAPRPLRCCCCCLLLRRRLLLLLQRRILRWVLLLLLARRHRPVVHGDGHGWGTDYPGFGGPWSLRERLAHAK